LRPQVAGRVGQGWRRQRDVLDQRNAEICAKLSEGAGPDSRSVAGHTTAVRLAPAPMLCRVGGAGGGHVKQQISSELPHGFVLDTSQPATTQPAPYQKHDVEVLGDRVKCDFRYQELKLPPAQYQAFKRKCMGSL
jgi:hypothetical protein